MSKTADMVDRLVRTVLYEGYILYPYRASAIKDQAHVAITLETDPGRDLGRSGLPGNRFFRAPEELEPLDGES